MYSTAGKLLLLPHSDVSWASGVLMRSQTARLPGCCYTVSAAPVTAGCYVAAYTLSVQHLSPPPHTHTCPESQWCCCQQVAVLGWQHQGFLQC